MTNDQESEKLPDPEHKVIDLPKNVDLPPGKRDNPPEISHTEIKPPEGRDLEEPTEVAKKVRQSRPEP